MGLDNPSHIAILVVILLLVFGARRLPEIGRSLGSGLREFKGAVTGEGEKPPAATPSQAPAASATPMTSAAPASPQPPAASSTPAPAGIGAGGSPPQTPTADPAAAAQVERSERAGTPTA